MTDPRAAAVEAAALAFVNHNRTACGAPTLGQLHDTSPIPDATSAAIAAFEARMAEAGWVMVPVKPTREMVDAAAQAPALKLAAMAFYDAMIRAAMLGRDDPPRADVKQPPQIIEDVSDE